MILFSLSDIVHELNLVGYKVPVEGIFIPVSEDENLVPVYFKQLRLLLVYQILLGIICGIEHISYWTDTMIYQDILSLFPNI